MAGAARLLLCPYDVPGLPALYVIGPDGAFLHVHGDDEVDFEARGRIDIQEMVLPLKR